MWTTCLPSTEKRGKAWLCLDWEKISAEMSSLLAQLCKKAPFRITVKIWRRIASYSSKSANVYTYCFLYCIRGRSLILYAFTANPSLLFWQWMNALFDCRQGTRRSASPPYLCLLKTIHKHIRYTQYRIHTSRKWSKKLCSYSIKCAFLKTQAGGGGGGLKSWMVHFI